MRSIGMLLVPNIMNNDTNNPIKTFMITTSERALKYSIYTTSNGISDKHIMSVYERKLKDFLLK